MCWVLSVSWLKRNPTPEDTSTKQRRIQTSPSRDPVQTRSLAQSDQHQTNKIVQKGIFFKNMKRMEAWTYSLSSHLSFLSVPYFYILILCWFVIIEVHWWVSGQRARYETVCMERFLRLKAKKMSSKFVRLKWEYFYCDYFYINYCGVTVDVIAIYIVCGERFKSCSPTPAPVSPDLGLDLHTTRYTIHSDHITSSFK